LSQIYTLIAENHNFEAKISYVFKHSFSPQNWKYASESVSLRFLLRNPLLMRKFLLKIYPGLFTALVVLAILWLTLAPHPLPSDDIPMFEGADKVVHALMFGGLVFALTFDRRLFAHRRQLAAFRTADNQATPSSLHAEATRGGSQSAMAGWMVLLCFAVASSLFGGVIELLQDAMGLGRGGDVWDFCADTVGALFFAAISPWFVAKFLGK
jgi:hypothetical protein